MADNNFQNNNQIVRKDGKNCFVEVLNTYFRFNKVAFNFVEYDPSAQKGSKFKNQVLIFINFDAFLRICHDMLVSRKIPAELAKSMKAADEKSKSTGKKQFPTPIILTRGGTSEARLKARNASRPDGKALAKMLKISPGYKFPCIFRAEQGPGKSNETGLIVPQYDKPEQVVSIGLTAESLKEMFLITEAEVRAFINTKYSGSQQNDFESPSAEQPVQAQEHAAVDKKELARNVISAVSKKANDMGYDERIAYLKRLGFNIEPPTSPTSQAPQAAPQKPAAETNNNSKALFDDGFFSDDSDDTPNYDNYFNDLFN